MDGTPSNVIPPNYYCLMRVKSWWSDTIRCEGDIKVIQNVEDSVNGMTDIIHNYDFIQTVDGFYKFKQTGLHKSNIYSINLKNTGLSKAEDKSVRLYTKKELIKLIEKQNPSFKYNEDQDVFIILDPAGEVSFEDYINKKYEKVLTQDFEQKYYNITQKNEADQYNSVRQNIRQLIQKAIRKSIIRYMPADTNLWKVEYQDQI